MFYPDSQEAQTSRIERRLQEELDTFNRLSTEIDDYLCKIGITKEQISILMDDPSQFTPAQWEKIGELKQELEGRLNNSVKAINDPRKAQKARSQVKDVQRHWLLVR